MIDYSQKIKTIKFILNKEKEIFNYSNEFYKKYKEINGKDFDFTNQNNFTFRTDKNIIKVFELLGRNKSSGILSDLRIVYIPEELLSYTEIINYDRYENMIINYNKAYSELLFNIMETNDISELYKNKFKRIKYIEENYNNKNISKFEFIN